MIVDAQFRNDPMWRRVTETQAHEADAEPISNGLPREPSEHLMLETLMFAWQSARQDRTVALMAFAMSSSVAETIAGLSPRQIRMIANRDQPFRSVSLGQQPRVLAGPPYSRPGG